MNPKTLTRKSKKLSWLLRHGAIETGLTMDAAGWAPIDEVLAMTRLRRGELDVIVRENNKKRLEVRDGQIRCSQGHSTEGTPVTAEALEASWTRVHRSARVFHGTTLEAVESILAGGISPMRRTHVHLADHPHSTVGKRASVAVLLEIRPDRLESLYVSGNGVYLTRRVPPTAIESYRPMTNRARQQRDRLDAWFAATR